MTKQTTPTPSASEAARSIEYRPLADLQADPRNPKAHHLETIDASVGRFGFVEPIVLDGRTGYIISGHGRTKTLQAMAERGEAPPEGITADPQTGEWLAPVAVGWSSRTDAEAAAALIALNRTTELGGWVDDTLLDLLDELSEVPDGLDGVGFGADDLDLLRMGLEDLSDGGQVGGSTAEDAENTSIEVLPESSTVSCSGDVWLLGSHRLLVGDATDGSAFATLMRGVEADMVWTDPPYGVSIGAKNRLLDSIGKGSTNRVKDDLNADDLNADDLGQFLSAAFTEVFAVSKPGAVWQVAAPPGPLHLVFGKVLNDFGVWRQTIYWVKNNSTFSPLGVHYHWRAEPIFHGWKPGAASQGPPDRKQTTVWEFDRPSASPDHPTMKPVALVEHAIRNHTDEGQIVLDPFLGSGTSLLAAEISGRVCFGMEISPRYADVICRRFEELTGVVPVRESDRSAVSFRSGG